MNRGKPNWEHLSEDLHVLITVEDTQNRAAVRLKKAVDEVRKLLVPLVSTYTLPNYSDRFNYFMIAFDCRTVYRSTR